MTGTEATATTVMTGTTGGGGEATATEATGAMGTATTGTSGGTTGGAMTLPSNCSNVSLEYWNGLTGPDGQFMQQLVDSFNQANQNIKVNMTIQAQYDTQMQTAAAADTLPDVAIVNEDQVATQAFRNVIRPYPDAVWSAMGVDASDYPAVAWKAGEVAGKRYAVPLSFVAMTMYYNQDLLTKAGMSGPPTNDTEFQKVAAAATQGGNHGFLITNGFPVQQIFQMLLHQFGGTEYSADGTQATWNSDAGVKALTWMKDAQTKYSAPKLEVDADLNGFKAGTAAMIWNGLWQVPNVTGSAVEFKSGLAAPPQIGSQPAIWAGGPLLGLPVHKKGYDNCKDMGAGIFVKYLIDNSVTWAKAGNVPASNKARNSADFKALPQSVLAEALNNPVFPPPVPGISDAFAPLGDAVGAIMSGTATDIKGTLDSSANRADQILTQNKQNYGDTPKGQ